MQRWHSRGRATSPSGQVRFVEQSRPANVPRESSHGQLRLAAAVYCMALRWNRNSVPSAPTIMSWSPFTAYWHPSDLRHAEISPSIWGYVSPRPMAVRPNERAESSSTFKESGPTMIAAPPFPVAVAVAEPNPKSLDRYPIAIVLEKRCAALERRRRRAAVPDRWRIAQRIDRGPNRR